MKENILEIVVGTIVIVLALSFVFLQFRQQAFRKKVNT